MNALGKRILVRMDCALCVLAVALWPALAAELPSEMLGGWCIDKILSKTITRDPAHQGEGAYYYRRITKELKDYDADGELCGNRGGIEILKDRLNFFRFGLIKRICKFEQIERDGNAYQVSKNCKYLGEEKSERERSEYEVVPPSDRYPEGFLAVTEVPEG